MTQTVGLSEPMTMTATIRLLQTKCWCGTPFAAPEDLVRAAWNDRHEIYCPYGHRCVWTKSEADKLRAELDQVKADRDNWARRKKDADAEVEHQKARANGYKGAMTKTKKRIGKGVCPCCTRHFTNVERHMSTQHPDFDKAEPEAVQ